MSRYVNPTFNLPTYTAGETLVRGQPGWHTNGMVPNITGGDSIAWSGRYAGFLNNGAAQTGCFMSPDTVASPPYYFAYPNAQQISGNHPCGIKLDASRSSGVYNNTTTSVRPAGVGTNFCIKY